MDFYRILARETKEGIEVYPDFIIGRSQDLMVQGRTFYAIWDEDKGLWSRDEYDVQRLVDKDLKQEAEKIKEKTGVWPHVKYMRSFNSNSWKQFRKFLAHVSDSSHPLDTKLTFANTKVSKTDYISKRLPYPLQEGDISAWRELLGILYSSEERKKIEWAIGSIVSGDSKKIQKFLVFYGPPGTGKSTILNILQELFFGYTTSFDGKALGSSNAAFATEVFRFNPLVAIQHDGDLSRLEENSRLNSIIGHEEMTMNEKYKPSYTSRVDAMLFIGSNQPVKISDAKSGIIRRLIDVHPTGVKIPAKRYQALMTQLQFEMGAIAHRCLSIYLEMGKNYYNSYRPMEMMLQTDIFFNYIEAFYDVFSGQDYTTLAQAYMMYREFCEESGIQHPMPKYKMREELRNYFNHFRDRGEVDGEQVRSLYTGFNANKFKAPAKDAPGFSLVLEETTSLLDQELSEYSAQLAGVDGNPSKKWENCKTKLLDIDTQCLHWVRVPENHVVIDFDLKDDNGHRGLERNLEAASGWPATYAELSKSGSGVHLHYIFDGDVSSLAREYSPGIEIKVFRGDASLRRRLSRCNNVPIAHISSGLPLKSKKEKMLEPKTIQSERGLRDLVKRNLRKEIHPGTKPSVDFIAAILDEAYQSGIKYDLTDMRNQIMAFANNSTNQAGVSLKVVLGMKFKSEDNDEVSADVVVEVEDSRIVFFDVEVYPNLFVICWKFQGDDTVVRMINPKASEVEGLFKLKLVGFYNRRYDNHILYAASMGYSAEDLFKLSQKMIVHNSKTATFGAAYSISYADIWDFSSKRVSLKKFEIDLGILHMELDIPWDQPVDEADWNRVVEYCANDVRATEKVFEDRKQDFVARQILADLSGLTVNDTTPRHAAQIIFGDDKRPQKHFVYADLSKEFPGYRFELGKSYYLGEDPGEGGYVHAEPGVYQKVVLLDVASMHPVSIVRLNMFGKYTKKFADLMDARVAIKHKNFSEARQMLDGRLAPYLEDESGADALAYALKIVINMLYGLTSAKFDNPFRDNRNIDNIAAKRGALFMIDLKRELQSRGFTVAHIKTDSIKIPDATPEIISFVIEFGKKYGYTFEHEATYDKLCLVNDAVYIAGMLPVPWADPFPKYEWYAVGAQFQHPYVYKKLFSDEEIEFKDFCEARSVVKGTMYLYRGSEVPVNGVLDGDASDLRHIGRTGLFVPVLEGGGALYRFNDNKYYAVSGTKGHLWVEATIAEAMGEDLKIDMTYFQKLKQDAIAAIEVFSPFEKFIMTSTGSQRLAA